MATAARSLRADQRDTWAADGYLLLRGVAAADVCAAMLARAVEIGRPPSASHPGPLVVPEARLHHDPVLAGFAHDEHVLDLMSELLGSGVNVVPRRLIVTGPGAYGRPWHQDSLDLPFEPDHQVGVSLALTEATLDNGCMWVLPGSQTEPVHDHLPDRRPGSPHGYVEIVDHDMGAAVPVPMEPGDVLLFDSHLMHRSTDNHSRGARAAMVYRVSARRATG